MDAPKQVPVTKKFHFLIQVRVAVDTRTLVILAKTRLLVKVYISEFHRNTNVYGLPKICRKFAERYAENFW